MPDSTFNNLKKAGEGISNSGTFEEKVVAISKAFEVFSQESSRLEAAYCALKEQYQTVDGELREANQKLQYKIFEYHILMNYLASILNNVTQGIIFIGLEGIITTFNSAAEKILLKPANEVLFCNFADVFPDDFFGFSIQAALKTGHSPERTFITLDTPEGQQKILEINSSFAIETESEFGDPNISHLDFNKGIILIIRDITEIRRLQLIAERNDRMKELGEMAAMVAHEIRNPLGGIKGFASLLVRDLAANPNLQQMAQYIVEGTDNLNRLVTDVLNYSRPSIMKLENVNLVAEMKEIQQHVQMDTTLSKGIEITFECRLKSLIAPVDSQMFKSVLLNLILNSIQAMPKGGKIQLALTKKAGDAIIKVSDTGSGIPEENLPKIFSPFFTTKQQGHGFGLSEVFKIVQGHQGSIEVKSQVGEGTTFTIKLPLTARQNGN